MRWGSRPRVAGLAVAIALAAGTSGCADDDRAADGRSSPFTVGYVPDGFRPITAGEGGARLAWGDDSEGTHRPLTVLERTDDGEAQPVQVTFFGYEGTQEETAFGGGREGERFELDGNPARYRAASPDHRGTWSDLTVEVGDDLAVRVASPEASRDELTEIFEEVDLPDGGPQIAAPRIEEPPPGVRVVGSMDARAVLGEMTYVWGAPEIHGPPGSHVAMWRGPADLELVVQTLPGGAADLAGIAAAPYEDRSVVARVVDLDGREAAVIESTADDPPPLRQCTVWIEADWGDLVHVKVSGPEPLSLDEVARVVASIEPATREEWEAYVSDL